LETGSRKVVVHAVRQNNIIFVFKSALTTDNHVFGDYLKLHGDAVKDVAFAVDDCRGIYAKAIARGGKSIRAPWEESDENGTVVMATIATYGEVEHTFVQRTNYKGEFLPGFMKPREDPIVDIL
jgi:4-hydroxyphenylpyruvate dioxygenase